MFGDFKIQRTNMQYTQLWIKRNCFTNDLAYNIKYFNPKAINFSAYFPHTVE